MDAIRAANIVYDDTRAAQATYAAQLVSLDAAQQKVALSQLALNQQQREAVLNFTKLTAAGQNYTVEQLAEEMSIKANTLAKALNLKETDRLTEATIANAIATGALRGELAESVLQYLASKVAEDAKTASTIAATGAQQGYNLALKETALLMLKTPMGWISLLMMLIPLLVTAGKKFKEMYEAAHPTLEQLQTDLANLQDELSELDDKLDDNNARLSELRALREGGTISIVESEELRRLERENELLDQQIQLQKDLIAAKRREVNEKAAGDARNWLNDSGLEMMYAGYSGFSDAEFEQKYTGAGGLRAVVEDYKAAKEAFDKAVADGAAAATDAEKESFKAAADGYQASMDVALERMVDLQDEAIKLRSALDPDDPESAGLIRELDLALDRIAVLRDPEAARDSIFGRFFETEADLTNEKIAEFNAYLRELGLITEDIPKDELADMLRGTGDAAEDEAGKIKGLLDVLDRYSVKSREIYAHGGNVDLLDRRVVEVTNANLGKVQTHDANAQVGDRMTVLSKTIQQGESALVVTPILPNGEILSDQELDKYVQSVIKKAKKDKSTDYQAYDQKGLFLGVFGDKTTFDANNKDAEEFAERLHEIHEAILEAGSGDELGRLVAELQELTEYNPSIATMAEKFADAESKVDKLSKALQEFSKEGTITNDTLAEIGKVFGDYETYENFAKVMMDSASSMEEAQAAADALASEFMNSTTVLDMLREGNAELVKVMLEKIGVTNADEVVESRLRLVRLEAKVAALGLADAEWSVVEQKLREIGATNADITAIEALRKKQLEAKIATTDFATANAGTIATLIQMANAAGIAGKRMQILAQMQKLEASASPGMKATTQYGMAMKRYQDMLLEGFTDDLKVELPEVTVSVPKASGSGSGSGSTGSSKKDTDRYFAEIDRFREAIKRLEDAQEEAERLNGKLGRTDGLWDQIKIHKSLVDVYEDEQAALHNLNEERRKAIAEGVEKLQKLGFEVDYDAQANNLYIRNLEHLNELATSDLTKYETMADMSVNILGKYDNAQEATNGLIKDTEGIIDNITKFNDANKEGSQTWWDVRDTIRAARQSIVDNLKAIASAAHDAVDEIQSVYETLHSAADEYAESGGFISIDTYQSILQLGEQYMQYLRDENGLLVINEETIQSVIAAKTRQMAVEQAFTYVKRLEEAIEKDSIEDLNQIIFATSEATDATWGLVYANLAMLDLTDEQYAAALHNINTIRDLAEVAVQSIGKETGAFKKSLEDMKNGLDDLLKYIMDMLRDRTNQQIEALEEMKKAYAEIINQRKEALRLAKDENDYQKSMAQRMKELAKLQAKYDALSLDDSRAAKAERASIAEEMAKLQDEINEAQSERMVSKTEDALDDMQKAYEQEKDSEIDILKDSISSTEKLYRMAMDYLNNEIAGDYKKLRDQLCEWNYEMGSSFQSEIEEAVDNAIAALERFGGSYQEALAGVKAEIESMSGENGVNLTVGRTGEHGEESQSWREQAGAGIVQQMKANSEAWFDASAEERRRLEDANVRLAERLEGIVGGSIERRNGVWYWNGQPLYPQFGIFHSGGVVGGTPKENEEFALLKDHEWVLTEQMADRVTGLLERMNKLQGAAMNAPSDIRQQLIGGAPQSVSTVTSSNAPVTIQFGDTTINGASAETVQQHVQVTREMVNEILRVMKRDLYH